jgi:uncharacterized damage-inducible protein DinB
MAELDFICDQLRRIHEGPAWHGPSLREALEGLTAEQANHRPMPGVHSIADLTHHVAAWEGEVERRITGHESGMPAEGDFPADGTRLDAAQWKALRERLDARCASMLSTVQALDPARLKDLLPTATTERVSVRGMLNGLVQHNAYHAGQIVLLRRAQGA